MHIIRSVESVYVTDVLFHIICNTVLRSFLFQLHFGETVKTTWVLKTTSQIKNYAYTILVWFILDYQF